MRESSIFMLRILLQISEEKEYEASKLEKSHDLFTCM